MVGLCRNTQWNRQGQPVDRSGCGDFVKGEVFAKVIQQWVLALLQASGRSKIKNSFKRIGLHKGP